MSYSCWEVDTREIYFSGHVIYKNNYRNTHNLLEDVVWQENLCSTSFKLCTSHTFFPDSLLKIEASSQDLTSWIIFGVEKRLFFFFSYLKVPWNSSACFTFSLSHIPSLAPCPVTVGSLSLQILTGWTLEGWLQWWTEEKTAIRSESDCFKASDLIFQSSFSFNHYLIYLYT